MKRVIIIFLLTMVLLPSFAKAIELQFFNTNVLGKSTSESFNPLELVNKTTEHVIEPKIIQLDTDDGIYVASSIFYSTEEISFSELVEIIDIKYPNSKNNKLSSDEYVTWRLEKQKFIISLSSQVEDGHSRVIYIKFMGTEKVMETVYNVMKTIDKNCNNN